MLMRVSNRKMKKDRKNTGRFRVNHGIRTEISHKQWSLILGKTFPGGVEACEIS